MAKQEIKPEEKVVLQPSTMGDMPVVRKSNLPVSVAEQLANEAKAAAMLERPVGGAISLRAGQISWQGTPVANNRLQCVVLDVIFENRWYNKPFNPEQPANPACFAMSREEEELAPHEDSEERQGGPDGKCFGCPKNAWGSDPRGGRGKACSQVRRLVLIPATAVDSDENTLDAETAIMKLPVTSTRYWAGYITQLAGLDGRPVWSVITEIYTEPHPKHQFHVYFNKVGYVPDDRLEALRQKIKASESLLLAPYAKSQQSAPQPAVPTSRKY